MERDFYCGKEDFFEEVENGVRGFTYHNYQISPHSHAFYEINIIQSGKGTHIIEGHRFSARTGNVFIIPPETVHAYENEGALEVYHLLLHPHFFDKYMPDKSQVAGMMLLTEIEPFLRKNGSVYFLKLTRSQLLALQNDLEILTDNSEYDFEGSNALKRYTVLKILCYWAHLLQKQTYKQDVSTEQDNAVMRALEYIHKNYGQKITLETLFSLSFVSRSTFLRQFNAVCGCSPMRYLQAYRIERVKELLAEGKMYNTEIAHECGFYDLSHMNRVLRSMKL